MSRQERTARATKRAAATATKIIEEATQGRSVTCKGCKAKGTRVGDKVKITHGAGCSVAAKRTAQPPQTAPAPTPTTCGECGGRAYRYASGRLAKVKHAPSCSRQAKASEKAEEIYNRRQEKKAAQKAARQAQAAPAASTTPRQRSSSDVGLAAECRRLRDEQGMAWWQIGQKLGLASPAASASEPSGKAGAHAARRLYASTGKEVPRTRAPRGKAAERQGPGQKGTKTERKTAITLGEHVIPEDMPDEEVVALVAGRWIEWGVNLADLCPGPDEWYNHEARVHPEYCIVDEEPAKDGSRTLRFREFLGRDQHGNLMSGPTRTVRLRAIHTVRG